jgi:predicted DNA-binding transcriptional regulator AlpA
MGKFPAPVKPGAGAFNAWFDDELDAYLNNLAAERDRDQVA